MVNQKEECPECKRKLRTRCFIHNKKLEKRICNQCHKRIGNNIFYVPFKKKQDYISNYGMSEQEKYRLWKKYVNQGCSYKEAWRKVYACIRGLKTMKKYVGYKKKGKMIDKVCKEKQKKEMKKKFVEGLK